jgi:hypothetical protein
MSHRHNGVRLPERYVPIFEELMPKPIGMATKVDGQSIKPIASLVGNVVIMATNRHKGTFLIKQRHYRIDGKYLELL